MATTNTNREFQDMLNEYLPNELLKEELIKRDYFLTKVQKDNKWKGGDIIVPFKGAGASSVKFGNLTGSTDIAQAKYVRGKISGYKEVWGSLIFNHTDIMQNDKVSEQGFLNVLADNLEDFTQYMKEVVSNQLMCGPHFAEVTDSTDAATGVFIVDRIEKFCIDQKITLDDDDSAAVSVYVIAIDINTSAVIVSATRGGLFFNAAAYTAAANAVFYYDGVDSVTTSFISVKSALLSATNGGTATLHGQTKTAYPYLQAINIDGSGVTAVNFLAKLFEGYTTVRRKARGQATDILMSYEKFGIAMSILEQDKGSFKVSEGSMKANIYGWTEIVITAVATQKVLKLVGIQEMDDDIVIYMDWSAVTFRTNGFFRKRTGPNGNQYFEVRAETGYQYIVDTCLFGELEFRKPGNCGIMHSIPALTIA